MGFGERAALFLGGVAAIIIGIALLALTVQILANCFFCSELVKMTVSGGLGAIFIGVVLIVGAFGDRRRELSTTTPEDQAKLAKLGNLMKNKIKSEGVNLTPRESTADDILHRANPNRPAIVHATEESDRAERWDQRKALFLDFSKNIFNYSWDKDEDKEVDDETTTDATPRTDVQMEEARRRNLMKDWVRDTINNESVFKMAGFGPNKPEQYQKIMELRTKSHKNHMKRILYLTVGEYYKQKNYEYSLPYTLDKHKDEPDIVEFFARLKKAPKLTDPEKIKFQEEFKVLFQKYRKQPPQDALFEETTPEEMAKTQTKRDEERKKEGGELAQRYVENHATSRDLRTAYFAGVSRSFIKISIIAQKMKMKLQKTKAQAKKDTEVEKVIDLQEIKLVRASAAIDRMVPGDDIKEDD